MSVTAMPPKTVALVGAVCLTTGWLLASMLAPPVAQLQIVARASRARGAATAARPDAAFTEQLHCGCEQAPDAADAAPQSVRVRQRVARRRGHRCSTAATDAPADAVEPAPRRAGADRPVVLARPASASATPRRHVRTAVLSDGRPVHLVKAGDTRRRLYGDDRITDDSVTLADASGAAARHRAALRAVTRDRPLQTRTAHACLIAGTARISSSTACDNARAIGIVDGDDADGAAARCGRARSWRC